MKNAPAVAESSTALPLFAPLPFAWLGIAALAAGFVAAGLWLLAALTLVLAIAWTLVRRWRHPFWLDLILMLCFFTLVAAGFLRILPASGLAVIMIALLSAWDLERFLQRLNADCDIHQPEALVRLHLQRLLVVNILGLALAVLALLLQLNLGLMISLLLILVAGISLNFGIGYLQKRMDQ